MPRSPLDPGEKLACVSYAPFRGAQSPLNRALEIPAEQIDADLAKLAEITSCIRTYSNSQGLDQIAEIARKYGLSVLQGIWLSRDPERNRLEIETGIALARNNRDVIKMVIVGNEVLLRGEMAVPDLKGIIERVKRETGLPVTYADVWEYWLRNRELAPAVDFVTIHVLPYWEDFPLHAALAARHVAEVQAKVAASFPNKQIMIGEVGWPSAGRMRDGALPSPANQARVMEEVIAIAKRNYWPINLIEAFDQPWKRQLEGTVGGHWGLYDGEKRLPKFAWGAPVRDHPLWFYQCVLGILLAFVTFAAAYFAARSQGEEEPEKIHWPPIAAIALAGGLFVGWALVLVPLESLTIIDWIKSTILVLIAFITPPVAAAAAAYGTPMAGFATVLDPLFRRAAKPLERLLAALLLVTVALAIVVALGLVFDPRYRDFPFAPFTGPAVALFAATFACPPGLKREGVAEPISAAILAGSAIYIFFNEGLLNWQAQWLAALFLLLAAACLRLRVVRS
ncbi:MAG TPA: beta-(1-6) glucans synthase [Xanthobacteraceae bacterium]|nr:beta-(1-6) glucans synthase [Xanthobacteraceae bacterium]